MTSSNTFDKLFVCVFYSILSDVFILLFVPLLLTVFRIFVEIKCVICIFYEVGVGSYGVVVAAKDHNNDSELVAVKKMINVFDHKTFARRTLR